jgi:proteasome lid subunit RPN8/RPN11
MAIYLSPEHRLTMQTHAEAAYPEECCGLLLGQIQSSDPPIKIVSEVRAMRNIWDKESALNFQLPSGSHPSFQEVHDVSKIDRYSIDPQEMLVVQQKARECSLEIIGIYHSHPDARAVPSAFDEAIAWSLYSYAIVSVCQGQTDDLQSWLLDDKGNFQSEPIHLLGTKQIL